MYSTARQAYIDILTELVKEEAPTLYLEDFLYYYNKAISEYIKARYEIFEATQRVTDDLRAWKKIYHTTNSIIPVDSIGVSDGYEYRHLLNCIVNFEVFKPVRSCETRMGGTFAKKATRLTSSIKSGIVDNVYLKASFNRPYFDLLGNIIEIYIGDIDPNSIKISTIDIEYLKQPAKVDLTEAQVAEDNDTSQVLEFSEDIGGEINKIAMRLILERGMNPRLQSQIAVNQTVSDLTVRGGVKKQ